MLKSIRMLWELNKLTFIVFLESKNTSLITFSDEPKEMLHAATFWIDHVNSRTYIPVEGTLIQYHCIMQGYHRVIIIIVPKII